MKKPTPPRIETRGRKPAADPVRSLSISLPGSQWDWIDQQPDGATRSAPIRRLIAAAMKPRTPRTK